jgi:hypothetical protein
MGMGGVAFAVYVAVYVHFMSYASTRIISLYTSSVAWLEAVS